MSRTLDRCPQPLIRRLEFYRQEGYQTGVQIAKESEKLHFARLNDLMREAEKVAKGV